MLVDPNIYLPVGADFLKIIATAKEAGKVFGIKFTIKKQGLYSMLVCEKGKDLTEFKAMISLIIHKHRSDNRRGK